MKNIEMKNVSRIAAIVVAVPFLIGAVYLLSDSRNRFVEAMIINVGPRPMEDVIVYVTGKQYSLGGIDIGASATAKVSPRGESHIEVSYSSNGRPNRLAVDCYFERGYSGRITVEVENDSIKRVTNNIKLSPL